MAKITKAPMKVGLFGIGLDAYWPQFEGLKERLKSYVGVVENKLARDDVEVVNLGLIDTPEKAVQAGHDFRAADVDVIFLYVTTYALSSTVLPVVRRAGIPVIILNLQPVAAIDYTAFNALGNRTQMTGEWLAHCASCPVPEIANVFTRAGIDFHQITGVLEGDAHVDAEIEDWIEAARVGHVMAHNKLGVMGRYYNGMLDIYSDMALQSAAFGTVIEIVEIDELAAIRSKLTDAQVDAALAQIKDEFDVQSDCSEAELRRAASTAAALFELVDRHGLGSMAYYYESTPGTVHEDIITSVILGCSMLTASGVPIAGEYEVKNAQAMKIMDSFGAGGSFTEYYCMDFNEDLVLMGHDGPGHTQIAEGKTKVRPLEVYHGKVGAGVSVEMSVKHGPVTCLSVLEIGGKVSLLVAEGESVPGTTLEIGNTNSRYSFPIGARKFVEDWNAAAPAHHCAVGVGHIASRIEKLGALLGLEVIRVC
ncbi:arabinose isomerase [Yoonia sediminilitoris]|uniref:L-arabinose isomerase n=1 Tax=Yoonia sediminilitoris TaxID=1286148 RepID=A0A2T6K6V0_9RHOB|nr:arabinose isomerase [Yoonia sediminilitoris]PUB10383.1 L-arabinose isomerase [Yoonia sediminilitoris]RCW89849.1 L-arabinose isomerase [Yoonia sediminilitoris]